MSTKAHELAIKRWNRLPKVRREQALYDVRFRLSNLRANGEEGSKRDRAEAVLFELLLISAGFSSSDSDEK